jgi:branched-chain amino acid aminotransferase
MNGLLFPIWFNGELQAVPVLSFDPTDRGFLLGDGAFETLAVFNGTAIDLSLHVERLMKASAALGLGLVDSEIMSAVKTLLDAHGRVNAVMRISASRGPGVRALGADGTSPTILITLSPWTRGTLNQSVSLITSRIRRNESSPAARLKLLSYADNILAAREARQAGAEDALLLNSRGYIACTTIANIVVVKGTQLSTPPVEDGALPGIIRHYIGASQKPIAPGQLLEASGVFLTNSLRIVRPVLSLDGLLLPAAAHEQIAAIFVQQCLRIQAQCGIDPRAIDGGLM